MNEKMYEKHENTARKILAKSKINLKDYKEFNSIPFDDFTEEQQVLFGWYNEGMFTRLPEVVEQVGNDDFLD